MSLNYCIVTKEEKFNFETEGRFIENIDLKFDRDYGIVNQTLNLSAKQL